MPRAHSETRFITHHIINRMVGNMVVPTSQRGLVRISGFATAAVAVVGSLTVLVLLTGWALSRHSTTRQLGQQDEAPDRVPQAVRERRRRHLDEKRAHQLATLPAHRLDPPQLPDPHPRGPAAPSPDPDATPRREAWC